MKNTTIDETSLQEEYYPISLAILSSFPKYRPSVDLYIFQEDIGQLFPLAMKGVRLTEQKIEDIDKACQEGSLFVPRSDHHIYVEHLAKQADFVLIDPNLNTSEIVQIILKAFSNKLQNLVERPLPVAYADLHADLMVFVEYLWRDKDYIQPFMDSLHVEDDDLIAHSINTLIVGTWLYFQTEKTPDRAVFECIVQGLILHDIGCTKLPSFIVQKKTPLTRDEMARYVLHPAAGVQLVQKFACDSAEATQIILQHHERLDGSGYPSRLSGSKITSLGALAAVADAFSSMITNRPSIPRVKTSNAAQALFKDQKFSNKYTGILLDAYANPKLKDV